MMRSEDSINSLIDDSQWKGGWYQDITFPSGERSVSTTLDFDRHESRGLAKWKFIEPYLAKEKTEGSRFMDIGCNAGLHLVKASERYSHLYGIDSSVYFLRQCRYVLRKFGVKARIYCQSALDFDFGKLPEIDMTILVNSLYWLNYSDERGYVENADTRLHDFMEKLGGKTKRVVLIGSQGIRRIGGDLDLTLPFVREHLTIVEHRKAPMADRMLNVIYATRKN